MRIARRSLVTRHLSTLGVVLAVSSFAACSSERAVGPEADISASFAKGGSTTTTSTSSTITKNGLLWKKSLTKAVTRSVTVTQLGGGRLDIPELGFTLIIPAGAISTSTLAISVRAVPGQVVAYEFEPHGTVFLRPLIIDQQLGLTNWANTDSYKLLGAGYFKDAAQINQSTGKAKLDEAMVAFLTPSSVYWSVWHFSGYMVSMD